MHLYEFPRFLFLPVSWFIVTICRNLLPFWVSRCYIQLLRSLETMRWKGQTNRKIAAGGSRYSEKFACKGHACRVGKNKIFEAVKEKILCKRKCEVMRSVGTINRLYFPPERSEMFSPGDWTRTEENLFPAFVGFFSRQNEKRKKKLSSRSLFTVHCKTSFFKT